MSSTITAMLTPPVTRRDHSQGPPVAPITLVEYGDYECPYCHQAYFIVKELQEQLGDQLCFVFRNFPLTTVHPHAQHAAEAAEAAGRQHKFWEMHDTLYEHHEALSDKYLKAYATQVGLDLARFNQEMAAHGYAVRVREDFLSGVRSGVNGTPTFFINDVRHDGSYDLVSLLTAIEDAL
ncbi:thioredoxin domain-containing protein [Acidobacterium sp. S8]|uniref:DsbA family protein n=1 Tax=Acidobacterium sp. S8 TaxID=1641854 RepID=UPI00131D0F97|nr:thioredoxin domain-containing protein [Acidobacterium sp. S8]